MIKIVVHVHQDGYVYGRFTEFSDEEILEIDADVYDRAKQITVDSIYEAHKRELEKKVKNERGS